MEKKVLILAGGSGKRFWPKSTKDKPKQFLKIISKDKTMIQGTFERALKLTSVENIYVVTNERQSDHIFEQLRLQKTNVIMEPLAKNTATAIALGILEMEGDDVVIVLPSDHYVKNTERYVKVVKRAFDFAFKNEAIITIEIKPTHPETGYGYIEVDKTVIFDSSKTIIPGLPKNVIPDSSNKTVIAGLTRNLEPSKVSP